MGSLANGTAGGRDEREKTGTDGAPAGGAHARRTIGRGRRPSPAYRSGGRSRRVDGWVVRAAYVVLFIIIIMMIIIKFIIIIFLSR